MKKELLKELLEELLEEPLAALCMIIPMGMRVIYISLLGQLSIFSMIVTLLDGGMGS